MKEDNNNNNKKQKSVSMILNNTGLDSISSYLHLESTEHISIVGWCLKSNIVKLFVFIRRSQVSRCQREVK